MRTLIVGVGIAAALASLPVLVAGQAALSGAKPAQKAKPFRTSWGAPDLQGIWTNATTTPLERPSQMGSKQVRTNEERADNILRGARAEEGTRGEHAK